MLKALLAVAVSGSVLPAAAQLSDGLEWRLIGPFRGGRTIAATGIAGDPNTFFFGAVGGGVWKTSDAGTTWRPVFDKQGIASIGAMAVAPSNPRVIYVGTGETDLRSDISFGDGMYKSVDGGETWAHIGLKATRHIGRIVVDVANPDRLWVAALGHAYGPNEERGVFRSEDGGRSWQKVLYKGPDVGAVDLALGDGVMYAALWSVRRTTWSQYAPLGGKGSGLYRSQDGGTTWEAVTGGGLPEGDWGRPGVAVGGARVFVLIEGHGLYRSDDSGKNWTRSTQDSRIGSRGWYFGRVALDPRNPDVVYLPNVALYQSVDGGKNFSVLRGAPGGDDYHYLWIDPKEPARMICATDQGATITLNGGQTWTPWYNQPTGQFYHVITDNRFPYWVYGSQQDSGTAAVPSRTNHGQITEYDRQTVGGGESGWIAPDPRDPNIVYSSNTYGELTRFDRRTAQAQNISPWPKPSFATDPAQRKYRFPWTPMLIFSRAEVGTIYFGAQKLLKSTDGGLKWDEVSPDLTGSSKRGVIYTVAPSPLNKDLIWLGSDTGLVHMTRDGGKTWTNATPPGLTEWSKITHIEASKFEEGVAYAAVDRHRLDDFRPYLFRTRDYGRTWTAVTAGLAEPAFLNAVREDPVRRGLLFAATELGVAVSFDDGDLWQALQLNLPATSVRDLVVHGNDLVIGTHGRAFWILDDISPLRQQASGDVFLYRPATAVRIYSAAFLGTPLPPEVPQAKNPPGGAIIDYYLKSVPQTLVTLEVLNEGGEVIRRYSSAETEKPAETRRQAVADIWIAPPVRLTARAGLNRWVWDLREAAPGVRVMPGTYQVRLTVDGKTLTEALRVVNDPRSGATAADLAEQYSLSRKIAEALRRAEAAGMQAVASDLRAALEAAQSADRRPPTQCYALFEEAAAKIR
jgi:photosystem II stability/assembly factor-like uncharacterized protein